MFQSGHHFGLVLEPKQVVLGSEPAVEDHFQRDQTAGLELSSPVNDTHAPSANFIEQFVTRHEPSVRRMRSAWRRAWGPAQVF